MPKTEKIFKNRPTKTNQEKKQEEKVKIFSNRSRKIRSPYIRKKRGLNTPQSLSLSPNNSIEKLTKSIRNLSLGKTTKIEISFIIIGHGGIPSSSNGEVPQFKLPENVSQTNVLGLRYAGFLNYGNVDFKKEIYKILQENEILHNEKNLKKFLKNYNKFYIHILNQQSVKGVYDFQNERNANILVNDALSKKNIRLHGDYIGIRYNYGTTRSQKIYTGKNPGELPIQSHPEEIEERPLVKIFSIKVDDQEILRNIDYHHILNHEILVDDIKNGVTLTEIIEHAVKKTMHVFPELDAFPDKKIVVNVIDISCNSTMNRDYPTIEFIGPPDK